MVLFLSPLTKHKTIIYYIYATRHATFRAPKSRKIWELRGAPRPPKTFFKKIKKTFKNPLTNKIDHAIIYKLSPERVQRKLLEN